MGEFLTENAVVLGAAAAVLAIFGAVYKVWRDRREDGRSAAEAVEKYSRDSQDLARRAREIPNLLEVWDGKLPEDSAPGARVMMKEFYTLYHGIYARHRARDFPPASWTAAVEEMRHFISYKYIKDNMGFADQIDRNFGQFMRSLNPKRRKG